MSTAIFIDLDDAVKHQHGGRGQLGITGTEHLAPAAGQKGFVV
jgi:hypothetical protein